ncbi:MAG: chitobiase/beta-hexosaminidase C-terminal domain-containing protein [Muribaculaceae bacterium]|nr:chitobiase/beta-hexosaminidase C-terminal domain-containing protein [Muribaculaceae bacterium]
MKKIIITILAAVSIACAWAVTGGNGQGYDPVSPPDPEAMFSLEVESSPARLGGVSPSGRSLHKTGEEIRIYASDHIGYDFRCWMEGDEVVSTDRSFYFEMPARNVKLTAWYDFNPSYDPANPEDPFFDGYTHRVNIYCTPSQGGHVNNSNFLMKEGESGSVYAYANSGYKFSCWKQDGKIISVNPALEIKMEDKNLSYTAQFVYNPASPEDPGTNNWNEALGDLVIDHFNPGDLWSIISRLTGDRPELVNTLTVIGKISPHDIGVIGSLPGLTEADFSRTSGADYVPYYTCSSHEALTKLILPSSITRMEYYAFNDCPNLLETVCYAAMPPSMDYGVFGNVPETMAVRVYSSSLDLYGEAEVWKNFRLMALDEASTTLRVDLPADAADGRYVNASLQLNNLATGQSMRLIVTPSRTRYIFGNLMPGMKYSLYALSPSGQTLGSLTDFEMPQEGMDYEFENLKSLQNVDLSIAGSDGKDLTDKAQINWFDTYHKFLSSGSTLSGRVEGERLFYEILPEREMALAYAAPEKGEITVKESGNSHLVTLKALTRDKFVGRVVDSSTGENVRGAYVTVTQTINGEINSVTATTDSDGAFSIEMLDQEGTLTAGSPDHIEETVKFSTVKDLAGRVPVGIKPIYGADIELTLLTAQNVKKGEKHELKPFEDTANVKFLITDSGTGRSVENYRVRYPRLRLLDGVADDASLRIVALPRDGNFCPDAADVKLSGGSGKVSLTFLRAGDIKVQATGDKDKEYVALLYNEKGALVKRSDIAPGGEVSFLALPSGKYTVVGMMNSSLYSGAGSLSELSGSRLSAGTDYVMKDCEVEDGIITSVDLGKIGAFDESKFYYTGPETMLGLNKTSVNVGQNVTVRAKVDFLPDYAWQIDKVKIIFTLPEGIDYVDKSLLVGGGGSNFTTISDRSLSVDLPVADASPRFCVVPRVSGNHRISASVEFMLDGENIVQPIGSLQLSASDFSLSAPDYTYVPRITVRGCATPLSEIKVYDNEVLVGRARSLTNGDWRLTFDLYDPRDGGEHLIYAEIVTADGTQYTTSTARTVYDPEWAQLTDVLMINGGSTVDFNYVDAATSPASYTYLPGSDMFTFKAIFRDGKAKEVKSLDFLILLSDGSVKRMDSKYLPSQDAWVCAAGFDDVNRLPVNVIVLYSVNEETPASSIERKEGEPPRCPDAVPVIDPSGYVYEAVPSNRLEGVQATIFYKEWAEDMYGDVYENVIKWDAEAYAQKNPLFTDAEGMYQWDVPSGEWQVRFEKDGYETAHTEWLPVPPPQLDVNMGLVRLAAPVVAEVKAYEKSVEVTFDKYMQASRLNSTNLVLMADGSAVETVISYIDAEEAPDGETYAIGARLESDVPFGSEQVTLMVSSSVCSYAGVPMESAFSQEFDVEPEISSIEVPEEIYAYVGEDVVLPVAVDPGEAAEGKVLKAVVSSPIATVGNSETLDAEGKATLHINAELPGEAVVTLSLEGVKGVEARTKLIFSIAPDPCAAPVASVESGTKVLPSTGIELSSPTEDAEIWYTLDGSDPSDSETAIRYESPIFLTEDAEIRAIARCEGYLDSPESRFSYVLDKESGVENAVSLGDVFRFIDADNLIAVKDITVAIYSESGILIIGLKDLRCGDTLSLSNLGEGVFLIRLGDRTLKLFR